MTFFHQKTQQKKQITFQMQLLLLHDRSSSLVTSSARYIIRAGAKFKRLWSQRHNWSHLNFSNFLESGFRLVGFLTNHLIIKTQPSCLISLEFYPCPISIQFLSICPFSQIFNKSDKKSMLDLLILNKLTLTKIGLFHFSPFLIHFWNHMVNFGYVFCLVRFKFFFC